MTDTYAFNCKTYHPNTRYITRNVQTDAPLRAKSVCLLERPTSKYDRPIQSADPNKLQYAEKRFRRPSSTNKFQYKPVFVKKQKRNLLEKVPCSLSVQTLSIPMKYADPPEHSTSKECHKVYGKRVTTKTSNPLKQVTDNKRLCHSSGGKETENKLLLQISEAEQVTDFERILNSNAILWETNNGHVWRGSVATHTPSASLLRPRSAYSLSAVSRVYHYLFKQHEESLKPLIEQYRETDLNDSGCLSESLLANTWYENLHGLSEFYEDDQELKQEIETLTDQIIVEEVRASEDVAKSETNKNFNVNLAGLIELHIHGEGLAVHYNTVNFCEKSDENETDDEKEWPIMNGNSDDRESLRVKQDSSVDGLAQNLNSVTIDSNEKIPAITYSSYSEGCSTNDLPHNTDAVIHLGVPEIDRDESRPPMM